MRLTGSPLELFAFPAEGPRNPRFPHLPDPLFGSVYLPEPVAELVDTPPTGRRSFLEDDNRGAIFPTSVATSDGDELFLSVKGIGSAIDPYSWRPLDRWYGAELTSDLALRTRLRARPPGSADRLITGELWLRGSPYGGQGLEHATTALRISERADGTSLEGFRVAPVVRVLALPSALEEQLRSIYWYRRYPGRIVQELRLVPSNIRVYFHARNTLGTAIRHVFDLFSLDTNGRALEFERRFLASTLAMLTLFARTLAPGPAPGTFRGLDFHDVWLDKDAVLAPSGTVYFVDLEGIEEVVVPREAVREKLEDQIYRSLYELTFGYEQIEAERQRRFGAPAGRREHFEERLRAALGADPYLRLEATPRGLQFLVRNKCDEEALLLRFPAVDRA
jgi:hypothetical protein